jgi:Fe-S cluster assembly protein SufD
MQNRYYEFYNNNKLLFPGLDVGWFKKLREDAINQFKQDGFPDKNVEEWNAHSYKNLTNIYFESLQDNKYKVDPNSIEKRDPNCIVRLIFINGKIINIEYDNLPEGIEVNTLTYFLKNNPNFLDGKIRPANEYSEERLSHVVDSRPQSIVAINTAFHEEGAVIHIKKNIKVPGYIELLHIGEHDKNTMQHMRSVVFLDEGSECEVLENIVNHKTNDLVFTSNVTDIHVLNGSSLSFHRFIKGNSNNIHINNIHSSIYKDARFISTSIINSLGQVRAENRVSLLGENSSSKVDVLMLGSKDALLESLTKVKHAKLNTNSDQKIRIILDENSKGSFQGKIRVDENSDGTQANMSGKSLLLSNKARVNSKPELEILADDVRCSHGVTVGNLSLDQLFYLRSRGIPDIEARKLLVSSFGNIIIDDLNVNLASRAKQIMLEYNND